MHFPYITYMMRLKKIDTFEKGAKWNIWNVSGIFFICMDD